MARDLQMIGQTGEGGVSPSTLLAGEGSLIVVKHLVLSQVHRLQTVLSTTGRDQSGFNAWKESIVLNVRESEGKMLPIVSESPVIDSFREC